MREIFALRNVPARAHPDGARPAPLLTAIYACEGRELRFFSTLATFGTPHDVTLEELRIECVFPADDGTSIGRQMGGRMPSSVTLSL